MTSRIRAVMARIRESAKGYPKDEGDTKVSFTLGLTGGGASEQDLNSIEATWGTKLPEELKVLLSEWDGAFLFRRTLADVPDGTLEGLLINGVHLMRSSGIEEMEGSRLLNVACFYQTGEELYLDIDDCRVFAMKESGEKSPVADSLSELLERYLDAGGREIQKGGSTG